MDRDSRVTHRLVGRRPAFRARVLGVLFLLGAAAPSAAAMRHAPDARLAAKTDAYIRPFVESENFPGAILVARGDEILFSKAYGMANYELKVPNTPRQRFHLASLTKMFTAAAVLLLEEQGKLSTSDTVAKFLPDYPNGDKVLLEHLLTHTAGVPNADFTEGEGRVRYTTEQLVAKFKSRPLDFEPGSRTRYSNSNYNLLAYIVEKVSGRSYGDFLKAAIFDRLGMKSTFHDGDASALIEDRASPPRHGPRWIPRREERALCGLVEQDRQRLARLDDRRPGAVRPRRVRRHASQARVTGESHAEAAGVSLRLVAGRDLRTQADGGWRPQPRFRHGRSALSGGRHDDRCPHQQLLLDGPGPRRRRHRRPRLRPADP